MSNENNAQITLYTQSMKSYLEEKGIKDERLSYGTHVEEGFSASIKNNEVSARNGIFALDELIIQQAPRSIQLLRFEIKNLVDNGIPKAF